MKSIIILLGALALILTACTKTVEPRVYWDVSIKQNLPTLEAVAYNSKSTNLKYLWIVNGIKTEGKTVSLGAGRSEVQLVVFDDKGNSIAEYINIIRP